MFKFPLNMVHFVFNFISQLHFFTCVHFASELPFNLYILFQFSWNLHFFSKFSCKLYIVHFSSKIPVPFFHCSQIPFEILYIVFSHFAFIKSVHLIFLFTFPLTFVVFVFQLSCTLRMFCLNMFLYFLKFVPCFPFRSVNAVSKPPLNLHMFSHFVLKFVDVFF